MGGPAPARRYTWPQMRRCATEKGLRAAAESLAALRWIPRRLQGPIFIVGCPRSGTGILMRTLARHPRVANYSQAEYIWDPAWKDPDRDHRRGGGTWSPGDARRVRASFGLYLLLRGKERFLNKSTRHGVRLPYVHGVFPDGKIIHIVRDGRAVVSSVLDRIRAETFRHGIPFGRFCKPPRWREYLAYDLVEQACRQWTGILDTIEEDRRTLPEGAFHEIRYEDLCDRPRDVMEALYRFCDLGGSQAVLDGLPDHLDNRNAKWREKMTSEEKEVMKRLLPEKLARYGYDTSSFT